MVEVFFSYSHRDETWRDELEVHLAALKRQGIISTWHDRRIIAGTELDPMINKKIVEADIILLLISPYFLASDYCYEREMEIAMQRHENQEAVVIPIIIHPCDWRETPFGKLMACPQDGQPISKYPNFHDALFEVEQEVKKAAMKIQPEKDEDDLTPKQGMVSDNQIFTDHQRSSNLRIKKKFSDHEKDQFITSAFEYIANYFEASLLELSNRNHNCTSEFRRIDLHKFTASIYLDGKATSRCKINLDNLYDSGWEILYSYETHSSGSYNASLNVADDGYSLYLQLGYGMFGHNDDEMMTCQGAAEYYWSLLIEPLQ